MGGVGESRCALAVAAESPALNRQVQRFFQRIKQLPTMLRNLIGLLLLLGGMLWFLPVLGIWMIPLGLLVLSVDFPWARRGYLSVAVWLRRRRTRRRHKRPPDAGKTNRPSAPARRTESD